MLGVLGKYRLEQRLGGGGMAEVFLASTIGAEGFSRRVAIKRVLPGFSDNQAFAGMFVAEAQISSRLVHPNIVSVLDFDRGPDGGLFLVMELVEGRDLDGLMNTGALPMPVIIFAITEVLRGLGYAHDLPASGDGMRGIVHRDVSPHNVLLSWEGAVKVSDFGIAKARSASEATASVFIKGKPAYMSPEQANGQALDGRSDLFAVGVMMWEMLVGRRLFYGEDTRATLAAVLFGQIPRPRSLRGDIPKDLEKVTMKLLERDLPARYPTAEAAIADLLDCADAPKNGREAMIHILAERFPDQAQVRQSLLRSRSGQTPLSSPNAATIAAGTRPGQPTAAAAAPSLSSVMQARTGTLEAPRNNRGAKIAGAIVAVAVVATVLIAVIAGGGKKTDDKGGSAVAAGTGSAGSVSGSGPASGAANPTGVPAPLDASAAPPPGPVDAGGAQPSALVDAAAAPPSPVDAGAAPPLPVDARVPQKDASPTQGGQAVAAKKGRLEIRAFPVLTATLDGKPLGDTPISKQVPVGKHTLRLRNKDRGYDETLKIMITESTPLSIERMN